RTGRAHAVRVETQARDDKESHALPVIWNLVVLLLPFGTLDQDKLTATIMKDCLTSADTAETVWEGKRMPDKGSLEKLVIKNIVEGDKPSRSNTYTTVRWQERLVVVARCPGNPLLDYKFVNRSLAGANLVGMFVNRGVMAGANLVGMFMQIVIVISSPSRVEWLDVVGGVLWRFPQVDSSSRVEWLDVGRRALEIPSSRLVPRVLSGWTPWEECTGNPLKSTRRRHCHPIPTTREILRYCRGGPECDTTNLLEERRCYCGSVEWQPWQRWTECDLPQTRFRTRTRTCRVVRNSTPECPRVAPTCSGLGRESKRCPCDPPQWGSWYPWQPCELHTNSLMIRSRVRPCISLAGTCRNVTCVGSSVQVETCQCSECLRGLIVTCRNVTCVGSSVQVETCQCSEWSRGLIVTCRNVTCVGSSVQVETCQCSECLRGLIVTCRNVTCVGSSVQVETCQCTACRWRHVSAVQWSRGLIVTCRNVTCVGSSVQVETCQCREWSRGLIVTCRNVTCVGSSVQVETCQCSEWSRGLIVTCLNVTCVASSVQVETCQCKPNIGPACLLYYRDFPPEQSTLSAWTSWSECRRNTRGEQTRTRTRKCIPALSNPAYCEDAPATWRMCIGQGRTKQEVFCSTPPRIKPENECTGRPDGEYASSKRKGCTAYIVCCNGKATEHYCEHPKFFDSECQECISRSQTCSPSAKDGFDIHKDAMNAAKLQAEKHRFCTTRRRRRSKVCP
ncbi:hypothetical protein RRG08_053698, partial [Elysia crispata]